MALRVMRYDRAGYRLPVALGGALGRSNNVIQRAGCFRRGRFCGMVGEQPDRQDRDESAGEQVTADHGEADSHRKG